MCLVVTWTVVGPAAVAAMVVSAIAAIAAVTAVTAVVIAVHPGGCVAVATVAAVTVATVAAVMVTPVMTGRIIADVVHRCWVVAAVTGQRRGGGRTGDADRRRRECREHAW
jgi:hypothetical protein